MKSKKRRISLTTKHSIYGYAFLTPFFIGFILFFLSPLILYVCMGFYDIRLSNNGMMFSFAGFSYFKLFLIDDTRYIANVLSSLKDMAFNLPAIVIYSFFIATVLNQKFKGRTFFRSVFFLPVIIASGTAAVNNSNSLFRNAISLISGAGVTSSDTLNFAGFVTNFLGPSYTNLVTQYIQPLINNIYIITLSSGVQILIFLAAIQTVPPSIYEAAHIDGATPWETFWKITLPYLSPMIIVNSVYTLIDLLGGQNNVVIADIYNTISNQTKYSLGAAMGSLYFMIIFALMGSIILIMSKFVYYEDR
ncbi:MAG: carbohydrate ABC transporter permease [Saccharofermentanales bacterium]